MPQPDLETVARVLPEALGLEDSEWELEGECEGEVAIEGESEADMEVEMEREKVAAEDRDVVTLGVRQRVGERDMEGAADNVRDGVEVIVGLGVEEVEGETEEEWELEGLREGEGVVEGDTEMLRVEEAWADTEVVAL